MLVYLQNTLNSSKDAMQGHDSVDRGKFTAFCAYSVFLCWSDRHLMSTAQYVVIGRESGAHVTDGPQEPRRNPASALRTAEAVSPRGAFPPALLLITMYIISIQDILS